MKDIPVSVQAQQLWDQGERKQALDLLEQVATSLQEDEDLEAAFALFRTAYNLAVDAGDLARAIVFLQQLVAITRLAEDDDLLIEFLDTLAMVQKRAGDFIQARETLKEAITQAEKLPNARNQLISLWIDAGFVERDLGHLNKAREYILHALTLLEEHNEQSIELARALTEIAIIEKDLQNLSSARGYIEHALAVLHHHDAPRQRGSALVVQALIAELQNKRTEALRLYDKALVAYRRAKDRENEALVLRSIGLLYDNSEVPSKESIAKAITYYQQSLLINREIGTVLGIADNLDSMAALFQLQGNYGQAREMHKEALQIYEAANFLEGEIEALTDLGILERDEQHFDLARQYLDKVLQKSSEMGNPRYLADAYRDRGDLALAAGQVQVAVDDYVRVVEITESMRALLQEEALEYFTDDRLKAYSNLVRLFVGIKNERMAYTYMEQVKSREFLRRLSVSELPRPQLVPEALLMQESLLLVQLRQLVSELAAPDLADRHMVLDTYQVAEKQLRGAWAEIEQYNPEYGDLRHGKSISWQELTDLLAFP